MGAVGRAVPAPLWFNCLSRERPARGRAVVPPPVARRDRFRSPYEPLAGEPCAAFNPACTAGAALPGAGAAQAASNQLKTTRQPNPRIAPARISLANRPGDLRARRLSPRLSSILTCAEISKAYQVDMDFSSGRKGFIGLCDVTDASEMPAHDTQADANSSGGAGRPPGLSRPLSRNSQIPVPSGLHISPITTCVSSAIIAIIVCGKRSVRFAGPTLHSPAAPNEKRGKRREKRENGKGSCEALTPPYSLLSLYTG